MAYQLCGAYVLQRRRDISVQSFRVAHSEYKFCQQDIRLGIQWLNDLSCPACSEGMAGVHVDSNMKLFTWDRNRELWREHHYDEFFEQDAHTQLTLSALDLARGTRVRSKLHLHHHASTLVWQIEITVCTIYPL